MPPPARSLSGDVLADFIKSCKKYNVKPAVFYSVHMNWHKHVSNYAANTKHGAGSQADYNLYANGQITELLTGYGDLLGLWLDAGARNDLNPELGPTVRRLQPTALCHNCLGFTQDPHDSSRGYGLRWAGNENGAVREPSWGATNMLGQNQTRGGGKENFSGDPLGTFYCPAEGDTVLRQHYWFWVNGTASKTKDTKSLLNSYFGTVGNAGNLILDIGPNSSGAIPSSDVAAYRKFGNAVKCVFQNPLGNATNISFRECTTNGTLSYCWGWLADSPGAQSTLRSDGALLGLVLREDISQGQLIDQWALDVASSPHQLAWTQLATGRSIGAHIIVAGAQHKGLKPPSTAASTQRGGHYTCCPQGSKCTKYGCSPDTASYACGPEQGQNCNESFVCAPGPLPFDAAGEPVVLVISASNLPHQSPPPDPITKPPSHQPSRISRRRPRQPLLPPPRPAQPKPYV